MFRRFLRKTFLDVDIGNFAPERNVARGERDNLFVYLEELCLVPFLPKAVCRYLRVNGFDIAVTMRKLLTVTRYTGQDPEVPQVGDDPFWFGTDKANTPPPRAFTISMLLEF